MRADNVVIVSPGRTVTTRIRSGLSDCVSAAVMRRNVLRNWFAVGSSALDPLGTAVRKR
ncbi:hypothetical protein D3C71_2053450 [compost metagenome]